MIKKKKGLEKMKVSLFLILCVLIIFGISALVLAEENVNTNVIVFSRHTGPNWQIWVKNLDTKQEVQLTYSPVDKKNPQWVVENKNVFYRTANSEIYLLDIETKSEKKILHRFGAIMDQRCSKNGQTIVFSRLRPDLMDDSDIWISDLSGENARCLTHEVGLQYCPVFSPDAGQIAFVSSNKEGGQTIYIMNSDGQSKRELTKGNFFDVSPSFSPDGKYIAFSSNRNGTYDIWQVDVATGGLKQLTNSLGIDTSPVFSPNGENIAFVSSRSGAMQIWSMDKNGQNVSMVTQDDKAPSQDPAWATVPKSDISSHATSTIEQAGENIESIMALLDAPGDFNIKIEVKGKEKQDPIVVDGTTTFTILRTDGANGADLYKLYYFFDRRIRRTVADIKLPYKFKQTYKGLPEGSYEIGFVLIDALGNYGSSRISINVEHR